MDQISLTKSLFDTYKVSLSAYLILPEVIKGTGNNTYAIKSNPVLYLRYKGRKDETVDWNQSSYKINPKNLYRTVKFFNRIVSWFYDKDLKDLFVLGENNELIFNSDYNKLMVLTDKDPKSTTAMKAVPAVITQENGNTYEGIILYINKPEYAIPMTLQEVETLLGILVHFSFEALCSELLIDFFVAGSMGRITEGDSSMKRGYSNNINDQWK